MTAKRGGRSWTWYDPAVELTVYLNDLPECMKMIQARYIGLKIMIQYIRSLGLALLLSVGVGSVGKAGLLNHSNRLLSPGSVAGGVLLLKQR